MIPETSLREGHKLVDRVHGYLRKAILSGEIKPGTRLVETELAKKLGVSRSPVREAIMRLQQENLVAISALRVMVVELPPSEIEDLFWVRYGLEGLAARLATPKLSGKDLETMRRLCSAMNTASEERDFDAVSKLGNDFHCVFIEACKNDKLRRMLADVKAYIDRFRSVSAATPGRDRETVREHLAILEAFQARDPDLAEQLVRLHVYGAKRAVLPAETQDASALTENPNGQQEKRDASD